MGPTLTIDVNSSLPQPSDQTDGRRFFLNGVSEEVPTTDFQISGLPKFFAGGLSEPESSSSIGTPDESDSDEEEVQSVFKKINGLGSLDSLQDSLPIKFVPFSLTPFTLINFGLILF